MCQPHSAGNLGPHADVILRNGMNQVFRMVALRVPEVSPEVRAVLEAGLHEYPFVLEVAVNLQSDIKVGLGLSGLLLENLKAHELPGVGAPDLDQAAFHEKGRFQQ